MKQRLAETEKQFQATVIETARGYGWLVHHTLPSQYSSGNWATAAQGQTGYPDLTLAHSEHGPIFAELKTDKGSPTENQLLWLRTIYEGGGEPYLWRPKDWKEIRRVLEYGPDRREKPEKEQS